MNVNALVGKREGRCTDGREGVPTVGKLPPFLYRVYATRANGSVPDPNVCSETNIATAKRVKQSRLGACRERDNLIS